MKFYISCQANHLFSIVLKIYVRVKFNDCQYLFFLIQANFCQILIFLFHTFVLLIYLHDVQIYLLHVRRMIIIIMSSTSKKCMFKSYPVFTHKDTTYNLLNVKSKSHTQDFKQSLLVVQAF